MKYMLICNNCGTKHFTDGNTSDLTEVKSAPPPKRADGVTKDTQTMPKKFKCYNCGFLFRTVKLAEEQTKKEETRKEDISEDYLNKWENEILRSIRNK